MALRRVRRVIVTVTDGKVEWRHDADFEATMDRAGDLVFSGEPVTLVPLYVPAGVTNDGEIDRWVSETFEAPKPTRPPRQRRSQNG